MLRSLPRNMIEALRTRSKEETRVAQALAPHEKLLIEICTLTPGEALARLATKWSGLDEADVEARLDEYGHNELPHAQRLSFWADILHRCRNPLNIQLFVIGGVSGLIGEWKSAIVVAAMVLLSIGLSYLLDRRSNRAVEALGKRVQPEVLSYVADVKLRSRSQRSFPAISFFSTPAPWSRPTSVCSRPRTFLSANRYLQENRCPSKRRQKHRDDYFKAKKENTIRFKD